MDRGIYLSSLTGPMSSFLHEVINRENLLVLGLSLYRNGDFLEENLRERFQSQVDKLYEGEGYHFGQIERAVVGNADTLQLREGVLGVKDLLETKAATLWKGRGLVVASVMQSVGRAEIFLNGYKLMEIYSNLLMNAEKHSGVELNELVFYSRSAVGNERELVQIMGNSGRGFDEEAYEPDEIWGQRALTPGFSASEGGEGLAIAQSFAREMGGNLKVYPVEEADERLRLRSVLILTLPF